MPKRRQPSPEELLDAARRKWKIWLKHRRRDLAPFIPIHDLCSAVIGYLRDETDFLLNAFEYDIWLMPVQTRPYIDRLAACNDPLFLKWITRIRMDHSRLTDQASTLYLLVDLLLHSFNCHCDSCPKFWDIWEQRRNAKRLL